MKRSLLAPSRLGVVIARWWRRLPAVPGGGARVALSAFLFVATGLAQTLIVQSLLYSGGGDRRTLLLALPNYVGITLVAVVGGPAFRALDGLGVWCGTPRSPSPSSMAGPAAGGAAAGGGGSGHPAAGGGGGGGGGISVVSTVPSHSAARNRVHAAAYGTPRPPALRGAPWYATALHPERRRLFLLALNECGGFVAGISGIAIAGSGLYQVVFSGGTVVTAVLSVAFLKRRLSAAQWAAVGVITSGLLVTAAGQVRPGAGGGVLTGICFVLVSCGFYRYAVGIECSEGARMQVGCLGRERFTVMQWHAAGHLPVGYRWGRLGRVSVMYQCISAPYRAAVRDGSCLDGH